MGTLVNQLSQIKSCDALEEIQSLVYASKHPDAGKGRGKEGDSSGCDVANKVISNSVPMHLKIYHTSHYELEQFALFLSPRY